MNSSKADATTQSDQNKSLNVGSGNSSSLGSESSISSFESVICGGTAGLLSRFVIAPLDVVKIRFQLQFDLKRNSTKFASTTPAATHFRIYNQMVSIFKKEGVTALWKGNIPAEIMYVLYGATQFTTYRVVSNAVKSVHPTIPDPTLSFISGAASGLMATTITYPFDLLRTRFACQGAAGSERVYRSLPYAISHIYKNEGLTGYFRGLIPALISVIPYMGLMFTSYNQVRRLLEYIAPTQSGPHATFTDIHPLLISHEAIAGFTAGVISKSAVFPFDLLRKRLQVQGPTRSRYMAGTIPLYPQNPFTCALYILKREGISGFYRGFFVSMLKSAPASAMTMWTFENSLYFLRILKNNGYVNY
jgi:solute carrier family 25 thiamine pyrophosphate transporter 19